MIHHCVEIVIPVQHYQERPVLFLCSWMLYVFMLLIELSKSSENSLGYIWACNSDKRYLTKTLKHAEQPLCYVIDCLIRVSILVEGLKVILALGDNKEVRGNGLIVKVVRLDSADLMCSISFGHLNCKAVNLFCWHWLHEVDEEVVINLVHCIFGYCLEDALTSII